jgi:hypothetical protein
MSKEMQVDIDPTGSFEGIKHNKLIQAVGILPNFAFSVYYMEPESVEEAYKLLQDEYGFGGGLGTMDGVTLTEDDVWQYEGDPDLAPMATFHLTDSIRFNVYQHAMVSVTDGTTTMCTRMD